MELAHGSTEDACFPLLKHKRQIRNGHAEGVCGIRQPRGLEREKNCWQHCTDRFAQLACASFQLAAGPFYLGRGGPASFSCVSGQALCPSKRKVIREALEDAATSTNLLLVLTGRLNKHWAPDRAELPAVNSVLRLHPRPKLNSYSEEQGF